MKIFNSTLVFNQQGFTLLEILIAISLLAFITLGVVNITDNAVMTMERTTEVNKNNLQAETAMSRFEWDFSQLYSPLFFSSQRNLAQLTNTTDPNANNNSNGNFEYQTYIEQIQLRFQNNEHFSGISKEGLPIPRFFSPEKDVFEFFTSSNRRKMENTKQSHFAWVRYSLVNQEPEEEKEQNPNIPKSLKSFVRYFYADDPYNNERIDIDGNKIKGAVLLKNVEQLQFQFWDPTKRKWETSLRSIIGGENILRGVKILLTWYDDSGNKRSLQRVFRPLWPMVAPKDPITPTIPSTNNTNGRSGTTPDTTEDDGNGANTSGN
jgi:prepilin-type N-terminal cleavage/methylation domain-containing protein